MKIILVNRIKRRYPKLLVTSDSVELPSAEDEQFGEK
jgi:hypothetical protein